MKKILIILLCFMTLQSFGQGVHTRRVVESGGASPSGALYTDDFESYTGDWQNLTTRTNSPWYSANGSITLATSGISVPQGARQNGVALYGYDDVFANDQYAECTLDGLSDGWIGVAVRVQGSGSGDGYALLSNRNYISIRRMDNGVYTELDYYNGGTDHFVGGTVIRLEIEGTTLRAYDDGTLRITTTDATYSTGDAGMSANGNGTSYIRDWAGGDL